MEDEIGTGFGRSLVLLLPDPLLPEEPLLLFLLCFLGMMTANGITIARMIASAATATRMRHKGDRLRAGIFVSSTGSTGAIEDSVVLVDSIVEAG